VKLRVRGRPGTTSQYLVPSQHGLPWWERLGKTATEAPDQWICLRHLAVLMGTPAPQRDAVSRRRHDVLGRPVFLLPRLTPIERAGRSIEDWPCHVVYRKRKSGSIAAPAPAPAGATSAGIFARRTSHLVSCLALHGISARASLAPAWTLDACVPASRTARRSQSPSHCTALHCNRFGGLPRG
jgi:hypothetical protein